MLEIIDLKLFETDEQTAFERIQNDLQNGVDRSNVPRMDY